MVRLRVVHAFCVFPRKVAQQADHGDDEPLGVEDGRGEEVGDDVVVFGREAQFGRHRAVDRDEGHPEDHAAWDGENGVFGPDVGDQRGFAEHGGQHGRVEACAPDPVAGCLAVG